MSFTDLFQILIPEVVVLATALVVLMVDLAEMRAKPLRWRATVAAVLGTVGCLIAGGAILLADVAQRNLCAGGIFVVDPLNSVVKQVLLLLTVVTALLSIRSAFTEHVGEYFALLLLATFGMMMLVSSENLLMIFVSLELVSLALYILTALHKQSVRSAEAALKYFLFGGVSAAFFLFGLSWVYGLSGELNLLKATKAFAEVRVEASVFDESVKLLGTAKANAPLANQLATARAKGKIPRPLLVEIRRLAREQDKAPELVQTIEKSLAVDPLLLVALVLVAVGLGFKVAVVPFHLWAPDAYQGAPTPVAAFIASGSKVASFFILAKVIIAGFSGLEGSGNWSDPLVGWVPLIALLAALSIIVGNVAALVQCSVRRLLAYSAIAQAGYMLLGLAADSAAGVGAMLYYVVTYALTTLGAFGVVAVVEVHAGGDTLEKFAGLSRRAPVLSWCLLVFLLSLAGIPPLAGFFGKFYLFAAAAGVQRLGLLWLVILAIAFSAVALYYYLVVLKQVFVAEPPGDAVPIQTGFLTPALIAVLALLVVVLGCAPGWIIEWLQVNVYYLRL